MARHRMRGGDLDGMGMASMVGVLGFTLLMLGVVIVVGIAVEYEEDTSKTKGSSIVAYVLIAIGAMLIVTSGVLAKLS